MSVKERIKEYVKYKKMTIRYFEATIGVSNGYVSSMRNSIGVDKLEEISDLYPDLNISWLMTGKGPMLNDAVNQQINVSGGEHYGSNVQGNSNIILNAKKIIDRKPDGSITIKAAASGEEKSVEEVLSENEALRKKVAELELSLEAEKRAGRNMQDLIIRMQKNN